MDDQRQPGAIRIGIGGWSYPPWRGSFYPKGLTQKRELEYAARHLTSIEINATFYRTQKPETFARWHDDTPDDFVFAVKGPRYTTSRAVLAETRSSIERFFSSGLLALKTKLGPINWQFMPTKRFEPDDFAAFLDLLPANLDGRALRHAVEVRNRSFRSPDLVALARARGVAIVVAGESRYPQIADLTAPFVYVRLMGTQAAEPLGHSSGVLDRWVGYARTWQAGGCPADLEAISAEPGDSHARDVFIYVISGDKVRNPAAAMSLIERLNQG